MMFADSWYFLKRGWITSRCR